ncbi:hypothetical protein GGR57DRAFT_366227 [Xylariaceae sp. FL1272]|nr:hypothetical protein GGR57DRAFT_366227 [Xylariaceae sp. FL1272]
MVNIAIAGGSGQVAREVIDVLVATGKHDIVILSRGNHAFGSGFPETSGQVTWRSVNYDDTTTLAKVLKDRHTVLSFIQLLSDEGNNAQKSLIDACIIAGVKRFAPSEWGSAGLEDLPWWSGKKEIREYLLQINQKQKVLEYTLFQPGLFLEYLASPHKTAKHLSPLETVFDFQNCRAVVVEGREDAIWTFTTVQDVASVVARAVDYGGEWPVDGGIQGNKLTASELLQIGERVRGRSFAVERLKMADLADGQLKSSWTIGKRHAAVKEEEAAGMFKMVFIGMLLSSAKGMWNVSNGFTRLFPDHPFTQAEDYLAQVFSTKG